MNFIFNIIKHIVFPNIVFPTMMAALLLSIPTIYLHKIYYVPSGQNR